MDEKLVTVAKFRYANEAELAKMHLEEAGLKAFLADIETVNMDWFLGNAVGNIKLQVPLSQVQAAAKVFERRSDLAVLDEKSKDLATCLACGQPFPENELKCPSCGWTFEDVPSN
jgi:hypothetical protein